MILGGVPIKLKTVLFMLFLIFMTSCSTDKPIVLVDNVGGLHKEFCFFFTKQLTINNFNFQISDNKLSFDGTLKNKTDYNAPNSKLFVKVTYKDSWFKETFTYKFLDINKTIPINDNISFSKQLVLDNDINSQNIKKVEVSSFYSMSLQEVKEAIEKKYN